MYRLCASKIFQITFVNIRCIQSSEYVYKLEYTRRCPHLRRVVLLQPMMSYPKKHCSLGLKHQWRNRTAASGINLQFFFNMKKNVKNESSAVKCRLAFVYGENFVI